MPKQESAQITNSEYESLINKAINKNIKEKTIVFGKIY